MKKQLKSGEMRNDNSAAMIASILGACVLNSVDKLTFITSQKLNAFGSWLEQLIAESIGKNNAGLIPVVKEPFLETESYLADRIFIYFRYPHAENEANDLYVNKLINGKFPVLWIEIEEFMEECIKLNIESERTNDWDGDWPAYGISKACTNAYSVCLARENPKFTINACTPGFIETDLTRPMAEANSKTSAQMGMKSPKEGASVIVFLLMGNPIGSGHYYGSDCVRSPLDKYRSPGDSPYTGE